MKIKIIINGALIFLLSACNSNGVLNDSHNEIPVASEPSGASVYVMGALQGTTPMKLNITSLYPVTYTKENEKDYGRITLKRDGCSDRVVKVTNNVTSKGLKEKLDCVVDENAVVEEAVSKGMKVKAISEKEASSVDKTARSRLQELKILKDEGLIDAKEYQDVRMKILQSL